MSDNRDRLVQMLDEAVDQALIPIHYPHGERTGEWRIAGKCLDEPCVSVWSNVREAAWRYLDQIQTVTPRLGVTPDE
ncbi:MAG: hypothetical protein NUW01_04725 [Gemmatimonadaceae bacterium]|nr:hypothetical protein [Gemmatimonadaceae bacterium]